MVLYEIGWMMLEVSKAYRGAISAENQINEEEGPFKHRPEGLSGIQKRLTGHWNLLAKIDSNA